MNLSLQDSCWEEGLNLEDYDEVADYIQENFYDPDWYREHIDSNFVSDDEEDMSETPSAGTSYNLNSDGEISKECSPMTDNNVNTLKTLYLPSGAVIE